MIARIQKLFFKSHAGGTKEYPHRQHVSSSITLPTIFYSEVSPIYRFENDRSKLIRSR